MSKNQSAQKRKAAKSKKREQNVRAQAYQAKEKQLDKVRERRNQAGKDLALEVATKGIAEVAEDLRKQGAASKHAKKLTNLNVIQGMHKMIPVFAVTHGSLEIVSDLVLEKRFTLDAEQIDLIENFDRNVVRIVENINAIYDLIDAGKKPFDYIEIYTDYPNTMAELSTIQIPDMHSLLLKPNQAAVDQYVKEHRLEGESQEGLSVRLHEKRMETVGPKYRTQELIHKDMTAPLQPDGLVEDNDFDADDAIDLAKDISAAPTMKDPANV